MPSYNFKAQEYFYFYQHYHGTEHCELEFDSHWLYFKSALAVHKNKNVRFHEKANTKGAYLYLNI